MFLGLAIQPCMMGFLVSFSTQKLVFCVSKFGVVGRGLTVAPKDQGRLPDLTKLLGTTERALYSTALIFQRAGVRQDGGRDPESHRKGQGSPCSLYPSWPRTLLGNLMPLQFQMAVALPGALRSCGSAPHHDTDGGTD